MLLHIKSAGKQNVKKKKKKKKYSPFLIIFLNLSIAMTTQGCIYVIIDKVNVYTFYLFFLMMILKTKTDLLRAYTMRNKLYSKPTTTHVTSDFLLVALLFRFSGFSKRYYFKYFYLPKFLFISRSLTILN